MREKSTSSTYRRPRRLRKNVFRPDNLVIKAGDTVRWTNRAEARHIFASLPLLGKNVPFTPEVKPGETWEYTFTEPGDYYYFCFIHKSMVGKITVVGLKGQ